MLPAILLYSGSLVGSAIAGAFLSWFFQTLWENYLLGQATDITGPWLSEWRSPSRTGPGQWTREDVVITRRFGRLRIENRNNPKGYEWIAYARIHKQIYVQGRWRSRRRGATTSGLISLTIAPQGRSMFGVFHGPDDEGRPIVGVHVLGRDKVAVAAAKGCLDVLS